MSLITSLQDRESHEPWRASREKLGELREQARRRFQEGATGVQVCSVFSNLVDSLLLEILNRHCTEHALTRNSIEYKRHCCMVAIGGYGRGELAPYSDIDLLFINNGNDLRFSDVSAGVIRDLWDIGFKVGHSTRSLKQTIQFALEEPHFATSLIESRLLWGSQSLFQTMQRKFRKKVVIARRRQFLSDCVQARISEREEFGSAVQSLEPDVKRSLGGLRDLHLMRWMAFASQGIMDFDSFRLHGLLSNEAAWQLRDAHDFLTQIRADLHFHANRANDRLIRSEQLRIAEQRGVEETHGQRAVERFMHVYFRHTGRVAEIAEHFVKLHEQKSLTSRTLNFLATHRADGRYRIGPYTLEILGSKKKRVLGTFYEIMRLYLTCSLYGVMPSPKTESQILAAMLEITEDISEEASKAFMSILHRPGNIARISRSMFRTGVLERLLPEFTRARGLLQFNQYHSFTVDEHTFRAIEACESYETATGFYGEVYRKVTQKEVLHLALLLHDLGKGLPEDHSIIGEELAHEAAARLSMPQEQAEQLAFLVRHHLDMSILAFRRDTSDANVIVEFSRLVGNPDTLKKLFILTAADITAVAPGTWTDWKADLLTELYRKSMQFLSGHEPNIDQHQLITEQIQAWQDSPRWRDLSVDERIQLKQILSSIPEDYLASHTTEEVLDVLEAFLRLRHGEAAARGVLDENTMTLSFRLIVKSQEAKHVFQRVTGLLSARRFGVLSAEITRTSENYSIFEYTVDSRDDSIDVLTDEINAIEKAMIEALEGPLSVEKLFKRHRRFGASEMKNVIARIPERVVIDNETSEERTIIDVFAHDRPGLLFTIACALDELELDVKLARIATHVDQVVDVFYVTDREDRKITDGEWLRAIREQLERRLEEFQRHGYRLFEG